MTQEIGLLVFRIIPIENLPYDLEHGLFSKNSAPYNPGRSVIGNEEIINERDRKTMFLLNSLKPLPYLMKKQRKAWNLL